MISFDEKKREIAKRFLQTVLLIDDQISLSSEDQVRPKVAVRRTTSPENLLPGNEEASLDSTARRANKPADEAFPQKSQAGENLGPERVPEEALDTDKFEFPAKTAIDAFFQEGIIAGIYRPTPAVGLLSSDTVKVARNADALILDWNLGLENTSAAELIAAILLDDQKSGGRLRVIIIYTAETNLTTCRNDLCQKLKATGVEANPMDDWSLSGPQYSVTFFAKPQSRTPHSARKKKASELPELILTQFESHVDGLLPLFAVNATAELRANLNSVISKFDSGMDIAFINHRLLLTTRADAEPFLLETLLSVFKDVLSESEALDDNTVRLWLEKKQAELEYLDGLPDRARELEITDWVIELDTHAKNREWPEGNKFQKKLRNLKQVLRLPSVGPDPMSRFSALTSLVSYLPGRQPILNQGVVIEKISEDQKPESYDEDENPRFFLCVTPKCDCVRLSGKATFHFMILKPSEGDKGFDVVVPKDGSFLRLQSSKKIRDLVSLEFSVNDRVQASKDESNWVFIDAASNRYRFLGELRPLKAQQKVHRLTANIGRVGIDEFEWLRRHGKNT